MSRDDMSRLGIAEGGRVVVRSDAGIMNGVARSGPCRPNHVQAFWPECNPLLARRYDPASGEPDYNIAVTIEPASGAEAQPVITQPLSVAVAGGGPALPQAAAATTIRS